MPARPAWVNTGLAGMRAADWIVVAIGHPADRTETWRLGQPRPQRIRGPHHKRLPELRQSRCPQSLGAIAAWRIQ